MNASSRQSAAFSKVSVNSQTVIPREVCEQLKLKPGDTLRFRLTDDGTLLDKAIEAATRSQRFPNGHPRLTRRPMAIYDGLRSSAAMTDANGCLLAPRRESVVERALARSALFDRDDGA